MDKISTEFPEYSDKDIKATASAFRAIMAKQKTKEVKALMKMQKDQGAQRMDHGDLKDGQSGDEETKAGAAQNEAYGEDEEDSWH